MAARTALVVVGLVALLAAASAAPPVLAPNMVPEYLGRLKVTTALGAADEPAASVKFQDDNVIAVSAGAVSLTGTYTLSAAGGGALTSEGYIDITWEQNILSYDSSKGIYRIDSVTDGLTLNIHIPMRSAYPRPTDYNMDTVALDHAVAKLSPVVANSNCPEFDINTMGWDDIPSDNYRLIRTGGDTQCAKGGEYAFVVRKGINGNEKKVIVEFMGGGACWNDASCSLGSYMELSASLYAYDCATPDTGLPGFADRADTNNPTREWTHIFVPYCTQDIHWGDTVASFTNAGDINFYGLRNTRAVIALMKQWLPEVDSVLVTGCSAGAYGSMLYAPYLAQLYPSAAITVFADSGLGILTEDFARGDFGVWNAQCAWPVEEIAELNRDDPSLRTWNSIERVWRAIGHAYPDITLSLYSTNKDDVQVFFFQAMGVNETVAADEFAQRAARTVKHIDDDVANMRVYIAEGDTHCSLAGSHAWNQNTNGVAFTSWISDVINNDNDNMVESVVCANCAPEALPGCDGSGAIMDVCGVCNGDGSSCQLGPITNLDPTCETDVHSFIKMMTGGGTCTENIPQAIWKDGAVWDSYCRQSLHVCCGTVCSADSSFTAAGTTFYKRTAAAMAGMQPASDDCPSRYRA